MADEDATQHEATEPRRDAKAAASAALDRFAGLVIAGLSLLGLAAIAFILWPTGGLGGTSRVATTWEVDGLVGRPVQPLGRDRLRGGDVSARIRDGSVEFRVDDGRGRFDAGPSLLSAADAERLELFNRLRRDAALRGRLGVSDEDVRRVSEAGRGDALNVPEDLEREVVQAAQSGDADAARLAVARAANAGRDDFLDRTDRALDALRSVVTDDVLARARGE